MLDQQPTWVSPVDLGVEGPGAWKILAWQRSPLCMACGCHTVLVTPIRPSADGGWVVSGHMPPDGAALEASAFPEIKHRDRLLICWACLIAGDADDSIAEAVELPGLCAADDCQRRPDPVHGVCDGHWGRLTRAARDQLQDLGQRRMTARRFYLECRGDWAEVVGLARQHAEIAKEAVAPVVAAELAEADRKARRPILEAGALVRARTSQMLKVKAGRPQEILEGMEGRIVHTVPLTPGRPVGVEWVFPSGRKRMYPSPPDLLELVPADQDIQTILVEPTGPVGHGWTYEEALTDALRRLGSPPGEVDAEILGEDDDGKIRVRVRAPA